MVMRFVRAIPGFAANRRTLRAGRTLAATMHQACTAAGIDPDAPLVGISVAAFAAQV